MIQRTTIRIDHDEDDEKVKRLLEIVRKKEFTTAHLKGVIQTRKYN